MTVVPRTFTWAAGTSADWSVAADWNPSGPPSSTGVADLLAGAKAYTVTVGRYGTPKSFSVNTLNIAGQGNRTTSLTIHDGGTLTVGTLAYTGSSNSANVTINNGGLLVIMTALSGNKHETITIQATGAGGDGTGGHLAFGSLSIANADVTVTFANNGSTTHNTGEIEFLSGFATGSRSTSQAISNVAWGDRFIIDGANFTGDTATLSGNNTLTVKYGCVTVFTMRNVSLAAGATDKFVVSGNTITAVCYARGTMIRTPDGEVAVERLRAGRPVTTLVDGQEVARSVKWLGHRRIDLTCHARPETVAPIRIQRGAFADDMPQRDLMVSPDHAIFVDGTLICARQLVNGMTIRQETDGQVVDYYHVELDSHAILIAEGLPAESYLDTGNQGFFANSNAPLILHPDLTGEAEYPTREANSCVPFVFDEGTVRPVWQRLANRAAALGHSPAERETTDDPSLRLLANGRRIKPVHDDGRLVIFALPRGIGEVRLVSRAASPTDTRPWLNDRRHLGVPVARLILRGADEVREVPVDHPHLACGWWEAERDGMALQRWTTGNAVLPLPAMNGATVLEIHLAGRMSYIVAARTGTEGQRRAA